MYIKLAKRDIDSIRVRVSDRYDMISLYLNVLEVLQNVNTQISRNILDGYNIRIVENRRQKYLLLDTGNKITRISWMFNVGFRGVLYYGPTIISRPYVSDLKILNEQVRTFSDEMLLDLKNCIDTSNFINHHSDDWEKIFALYLVLLKENYGYLRFDNDDRFSKNDMLHPRYHFDINYSNRSSYKIGYKNAIDLKVFEEILDEDTVCYFLGKDGDHCHRKSKIGNRLFKLFRIKDRR